MDIQSYKISTTKDKLTSRSGLAALAELIRKLGLDTHFERLMPEPGSNRGLRPGAYLTTFMLMMHEGSRHLSGVAQLREERPLLELLGIRRLPGDDALGRWLRRCGAQRRTLHALQLVNRRLLAVALHHRKRVTLDIDATAVHCEKSSAEFTYKKERGYMPIVGHIAETGMAVAAEFRGGSVSPNARNFEFVRQCERALPKGVKVHRARIDAAGYQARIINHFTSRGIGYAVRARLDASVVEQIRALDESRWQPFIERDGTASETQQTARFLHSMNDTPEAFAVVVQRLRKSGQQELELDCPQAGDTLSQGGYIYRALATSFCRWSDSRVIHWYNRRGDDSENRIRELRSGFGAAHPPCSDFHANALHFMLCMLAFNLFALMRHVLDASCESMRIETFRRRLYCRAGKIVRHARGRALKLCDARAARRLSDAIGMIRAMALAP